MTSQRALPAWVPRTALIDKIPLPVVDRDARFWSITKKKLLSTKKLNNLKNLLESGLRLISVSRPASLLLADLCEVVEPLDSSANSSFVNALEDSVVRQAPQVVRDSREVTGFVENLDELTRRHSLVDPKENASRIATLVGWTMRGMSTLQSSRSPPLILPLQTLGEDAVKKLGKP